MRLAPLALLLATACQDPIVNQGPDDDDPVGGSDPDINVTITDLDFGIVSIGESTSVDFVVENTGNGDLEIVSLDTLAPFSTNYSSSIYVNANSSTSLVVRYQPTDYSADVGLLTIRSDDEDEGVIEIGLTGTVLTDEDGDYHDTEAAGGDDCDDSDPDTYTGATEIWYDNVDQDCLGGDDFDQDGDGFQADWYNDQPSTGGGDCNDVNAAIHPGAVDTWYDNLDSNCDGSDDWDMDGDGYATTAGAHGTDCDDTNASINPGAEEIDGNGIDEDCNPRDDD